MLSILTANDPFPLYKLPPELREHIYAFLFEDETPHQIELFVEGLQNAPRPDITAVSRLIRRESLPIYTAARAVFYRSHLFYADIGTSSEEHLYGLTDKKQTMLTFLAKIEILPPLPLIAVRFRKGFEPVRGAGIEIFTTLRVLGEGRLEEHYVWKMTTDSSARESNPSRQIQKTANEHGLRVTSREGEGFACIDLVGVVKVMLIMYTRSRP